MGVGHQFHRFYIGSDSQYSKAPSKLSVTIWLFLGLMSLRDGFFLGGGGLFFFTVYLFF